MSKPAVRFSEAIDLARCRSLLGRHFVLREADRATIDRLVTLATVQRVEAGTPIFARGDPGDGLYGILSGRVRIFVPGTEDNDVVLNILGPDELFGEIAVIDGGPRSASAVAAEDCRLMLIRRDRFKPFLAENADIGFGLLQVMCRRVRSVSTIAEDQILLPLPARLAKRLVMLAVPPKDGAGPARLAVTQRALADMVGAARESVNRILIGWREQGLVGMEGRTILVLAPDALTALARLD